jgi:hypothetical protein
LYRYTEDAGVAERLAKSPSAESSPAAALGASDASDASGASGVDAKPHKRNPVPWVIVDGKVLENPFNIRKAICDVQQARGETPPAGCADPSPPPTIPDPTTESGGVDEAAVASEAPHATEDGLHTKTTSVLKAKEEEEKEVTEKAPERVKTDTPAKEAKDSRDDDAKLAEAESDSAAAANPADAEKTKTKKADGLVDDEKINDDVLKMIADEMATAAKERQAKDLDMQKKVAEKIEIYKVGLYYKLNASVP